MSVTSNDIRQAIHTLGLIGQPLCVHSSLRSFGTVEGGATAIIDGLLAEGCTVLVPSFTYDFGIVPPHDPAMRPPRNGRDYASIDANMPQGNNRVYTSEITEVSCDMGTIPATLVRMPQRIRGNHPICSFAAVGSLAQELITGQQPLDVYAPFRALVTADGSIVLMGVGLACMTFIHYAEQQSGRNLFRRCALGPDGQPMLVEVGSCSRGFGQLAPVLAPFRRQIYVGQSLWQVFPSQEALEVLVRAIRENPYITHCGLPDCERCNDAVQGGPILTPG